ncbi:MAG TPA: CAP domain-containing protein [Pirellulales bacterium]|nr:CAP domain-containing protein [Pirellulales bacterium]
MLFESLAAIALLAFPGEMPNAAKAPAEMPNAAKQAEQKPQAPAMHPVEKEIIHFTNIERSRHGLPPLKVDETLLKSARSHAVWMTNRRSLQHTNQPVAENIALGQQTAREAVRDWMRSPGHRANILSRRHGRIGVAAFVARDGQVYWCQQFRN